MTSDEEKRTWEHLIGAETRANYFSDLASVYRKQGTVIGWLNLVLSSGTVMSLVASMPSSFEWCRPTLAFMVAAIGAFNIVSPRYKKEVDATKLHTSWSKLADSYDRIWSERDHADAVDRLGKCLEAEREVSASGVGFPSNVRKMLKWQHHVQRQRGV